MRQVARDGALSLLLVFIESARVETGRLRMALCSPKRVVYGWPVVVCGWPRVQKKQKTGRLRMAHGRLRMAVENTGAGCAEDNRDYRVENIVGQRRVMSNSQQNVSVRK